MPSSFASVETNSEIESLKDLFENEEVRYVKKGYGLISASLMTYSFFFLFPGFFFKWYLKLPFSDLSVMYAGGTLVIHTAFIVVSNVVMYFIYKADLPFFERYRISKGPWPWVADPESFQDKLKTTLKTIAFNNFVILPLSFVVSLGSGTILFRTDPFTYPSTFEITSQIIVFMLVEDCAFYWIHRLLHTPFLYKRLHKKHHEYKTTIGIAAEYSHPLEFVLANLIPTSLGASLLGSRCHILTWYMWIIVRILETTDGHCGYEFSWSPFRLLPLSGSANYHNFHHSHNVGNYSSFFTYWDTIFQTNKHYWRHLSRQEKEC